MIRSFPIEELESRRLLTSVFPFQIGSVGHDQPTSIASDRLSSVIVTGTLSNSADIDPSATEVDLAAGGFVAKYASDGTLVWGRQFGTATIAKVATDGENSVYLTGSFSGSVDFDPRKGVHTLTSAGGTDAFVVKLSAKGNLLLAESFGGKGDDAGTGLAVDSDGNIFVGGTFKARANFNPNGSFTIGNSGGTDGFINALDSTGAFRWAGSFGSSGDDSTSDLAVDDSGNVLATGRYLGNVDFDPGHGTSSVNVAGTLQAYVLKWDSTGAFVFADGIGGNGVTFGSAVTVDRDSNVYAVGNFTGTSDFDPSGGTSTLTAPATGQVFVTKLSSAGSLVWAKAFGGAASQDAGPGEIAVDKAKNVYVNGVFSGTKDFDPSGATSNLTSAGQNDAFVAKLDSSGGFVFAKSFGGPLDDFVEGLVLDRAGNILSDGNFSGTAAFSTGGTPINITTKGDDDIVVLKQDSTGLLA